ncbi:hypothetical protein NESM_000277600 [Novymonas esmeraldas]|uniref:Uncharacterized protein n=1 Tax=Novymonas esmeraldas TaxID=1808958 RepID=A0AAW0F7Y1_9TRYP
MPSVVSRDLRASWEIPFDFHPRIRAYPGATSVVRAYMDARPPTTRAPTTATSSRRGRPAPRHHRLRPTQPADVCTDAAAAAVAPSTAVAATAAAPHPPAGPSHARRPQRRAAPPQPACSSTFFAPPVADARADGAVARLGAASLSAACGQRPSSSGAVISVSCSAPVAAMARPAAHGGYHPRTKSRYSLPPSYSANCALWRRQPVPTIRVTDRHVSPPAARECRLSARHVRHAPRQTFVDALRACLESGGHDVVPAAVVAALTDATDAAAFEVEQHNFNAMVMDAFTESVEERAARLQATEDRMWSRLVLDVVPLATAHHCAVASGGVSVLDSGHVSAPIHISAVEDGHVHHNTNGGGEEEEEECDRDGDWAAEETLAVLVRPFADEVPISAEALRVAEAQRRWPKGREWDRQTAIRHAVGATVQEAIIDLGIDPRYRRPGDRRRPRAGTRPP